MKRESCLYLKVWVREMTEDNGKVCNGLCFYFRSFESGDQKQNNSWYWVQNRVSNMDERSEKI